MMLKRCLVFCLSLSASAFAAVDLFEPITPGLHLDSTSATYTFSSTNSDTINYARLCLSSSSDGSCTSCGVPFKVTTSGTALSYSVPYKINQTSLATYLNEMGISAGTYDIGIYVQSSTLTCNSSASYCSNYTYASASPNACITATYIGGSVSSLTQADSGSISLSTSTSQHAYVGTVNGNLYHCLLNTDGTFSSCSVTTSGASSVGAGQQRGIAFTSLGGTQYAYVGSTNPGVYQCTLNSDGTFNTCTVTPASGAPSWTPYDLIAATISGTQYIYVSDNSGGHVYRCTMNVDGSLNTCTATPASGAPSWSPNGITFATVNGTRYAYVGSTSAVYQCTLNTDGTFNSCATTPASGAPSWSPLGLSLAFVNGVQYAYVGSTGTNKKIYQCTLNSDGTFNTCASTPATPPAWVPNGVKLTFVDGTQIAYISSQTSTTSGGYYCTLNSDGTFNTCSVTGSLSSQTGHSIGLSYF